MIVCISNFDLNKSKSIKETNKPQYSCMFQRNKKTTKSDASLFKTNHWLYENGIHLLNAKQTFFLKSMRTYQSAH